MTAHDVASFHLGKFASYIDKNDMSCPKKFNYHLTLLERLKQLKVTLNPFRNLLIKHYLRYVSKIFAVSNALRDALGQNGIKNVMVVHNGIDPGRMIAEAKDAIEKRYGINKNKKVIFMSGRFGSLKGGALLLDYISALKKSRDDFIFVVASRKNDYVKKIIHQADKTGLSDNLFFTGWLDDKEMGLFYSDCNICLVPSICFDSFPNNNLEAMAYAKPVIGTCFGGTAEAVVEGQTGYVINPFNVKVVVEKIAGLLDDKSLADKFGKAGHQRILEVFSLKKQADDILQRYGG